MSTSNHLNRVFLKRTLAGGDLCEDIAAALKWLDAEVVIRPGARVFIKPNLTWRTPTPGVTVTPLFLRALVQALLPYTSNITIGESEGGQSCFLAEDAFETHGLYQLQREFGIRVVNLSKNPQKTVSVEVLGKPVSVQLPSVLLDDTDVFVTVPVPKVHAMTGVSLGFKNQWGCLSDNMRVTKHPQFDTTIVAINKILKPSLCIFDGTYFLDHTGPMMGEAVPMGMVIAGNDAGAASLACCEVMGINPMSIGHHRVALAEGMFPRSIDEIQMSEPASSFQRRKFRLRRAPINYIHLAAFHNSLLNRMFYNSLFADGLHQFLWIVRRNYFVKKFLYGKYGTGEANRGGGVR